ncbi:MAG: hypothetical protein LHV69_11540, partial [Elusimicrobia bacterium]|nr:hypothetical protein [Candidatus Obscuribacterium magneticum]
KTEKEKGLISTREQKNYYISEIEKFKIKKQKSIYHSRFPILDLCASFQQSVVDVLVEKTFRAAKQYRVKTILLGGGVSANRSLRQTFSERGKQTGINVKYPPIELCTDNAAMVASVGYFKIKYGGDKGDKIDGCWDMGKEMWGKKMRVDPELPLKSWNKK